MAVSTPLFGLSCYNSGLGGDPLEYFTTGRAYAEGQPFFSFIHFPRDERIQALLQEAAPPGSKVFIVTRKECLLYWLPIDSRP
jgi:hypothetical protein